MHFRQYCRKQLVRGAIIFYEGQLTQKNFGRLLGTVVLPFLGVKEFNSLQKSREIGKYI